MEVYISDWRSKNTLKDALSEKGMVIVMMDSCSLQKQFEFDVYPKRDIALVKGENALVWDEQGNEYIDCIAGHGVANIGHCNPAIISAVEKQIHSLITCSNTFYNDQRAQFMQKLISIIPAGLSKVFLCNSGAESVEAAIKFTRFSTRKTDFVCAMNSFHGRTLGALSATFKPTYRRDFEPLVPGFRFVPFNQFKKLAEAVDNDTAGIILEVVQGEGGVRIGNRNYFRQVRQLCDEKDILLIIDEVQTGFCRTGKWFACQHYDISPDILCLAKAMAGGLPIGATLCSDKVDAPIGRHGSTFGGNPLVCAAAIAAIDFMLANHLDQEAQQKGMFLWEKLQKLDSTVVREIRNLGLMFGIELKGKTQPYLVKLMEAGVLAFPAGATVIRLLPPLTIEYEQLQIVADRLKMVLETGTD